MRVASGLVIGRRHHLTDSIPPWECLSIVDGLYVLGSVFQRGVGSVLRHV